MGNFVPRPKTELADMDKEKKVRRQSPAVRVRQINKAANAVLLRTGVEGFTIDEVVKEAGIAKGTVYNYYKSKDELLADLCIKAVSLLRESFGKHTQSHSHSLAKLRAICTAAFEFYLEYPHYFQLLELMERPEFNIRLEEYLVISYDLQDFMHHIVRQGQAAGEIRSDVNPVIFTSIIWASCLGVVQFMESKKKLLKQMEGVGSQDIIQIFAQTITQGMIAASPDSSTT